MSNTKELPEKQTIEILLGFHDRHRDRLNVRMSLSWKINLALWSALGLLAGSLITGTATVAQDCPVKVIGGIILLVIFLVHLWWVHVIAGNNISDRDIARGYMSMATSALRENIPTKLSQGHEEMLKKEASPQKDSECWLKTYSSQILQVAITICLILLVVLAY